jgi:uncharacterized protein YwgA
MQVKNNVAYIIKEIREHRENPGKKTLQKLVFLIEQKGVDLNYNYGLHFYGPYSSALDAATTFLDADGIIQFDYSGYSHRMKVPDDVKVESDLSNEQERMVKDVIVHFKDKNPSDLELLSTVIYVYNNVEDHSKHSIIEGIIKIKGEKYSVSYIENALLDLDYFNMPVQ